MANSLAHHLLGEVHALLILLGRSTLLHKWPSYAAPHRPAPHLLTSTTSVPSHPSVPLPPLHRVKPVPWCLSLILFTTHRPSALLTAPHKAASSISPLGTKSPYFPRLFPLRVMTHCTNIPTTIFLPILGQLLEPVAYSVVGSPGGPHLFCHPQHSCTMLQHL